MKKKYFFHITQCTYNENESTELLNRILYEQTKYEKKLLSMILLNCTFNFVFSARVTPSVDNCGKTTEKKVFQK